MTMMGPDPRRLLEEAIRAGTDRDYRRAVGLLTSLLAEGGGHGESAKGDVGVQALLYLGRSHQALGESGRAVEAFRLYLRAGGAPAIGWFFLGRAWLAAGIHREAAQAFRKSAEADPDRAQTWALLGAACLKLKRSRVAVECLERAIALAPLDKRIYRGYLNALFVRAARLVSRGDDELARQMLGFLLENGFEGPATRLWRAKALRNLGRTAEALVDCEAALAASPGDESIRWLRAGLLIAAGKGAEGLAEMRLLRGEEGFGNAAPGDPGGIARLRVSLAFGKNRWREAAEEALALLKTRSAAPPGGKEAAGLHAIIAESLRALGQAERAKAHGERAVSADPGSPELRIGLALSLFDLGDYQQALAQTEVARSLGADAAETEYIAVLALARSDSDPEALIPRLHDLIRGRARREGGADPRLYLALGECLYRSGRPDLASTWFGRVLELIPDHELSLLYRISIAESLGDFEGRLSAAAAYLEAYPDNDRIRHELVGHLVGGERWSEAAAVLEKGLAFGDPGEGARRLLARAWRESGRFREAAILYRDLLRASPEDGELLLALCLCLDRDGKADYALALLEAAPDEARRRAAPWIVMGVLHARKGSTEKAVDALRKATEIEPGAARAWRELSALYERGGLREFAASARERAAMAEMGTGARGTGGTAKGRKAHPGPVLGTVDALARKPRSRSACEMPDSDYTPP